MFKTQIEKLIIIHTYAISVFKYQRVMESSFVQFVILKRNYLSKIKEDECKPLSCHVLKRIE